MMPPDSHSHDNAGYNPERFARVAAAENEHFWFTSRNKAIVAVLQPIIEKLEDGYLVLEIGCGTGNVLKHIQKNCTGGVTVGMDLFREALGFARASTSCNLVVGDARRNPIGKRANVVALFDVLEHIDADEDVLESVYQLLQSPGHLLLTVPAHPALWSYHDVQAHHCRRYTRRELSAKLMRAGFELEFISEYMAPVLPFALLRAALNSGRGISPNSTDSRRLDESQFRIRPWLNSFMSALLSVECKRLARRKTIPIGTSLIAVARRPAC